MAISQLLLGIPWLILSFILKEYDLGYGMTFLIIILAALPALIFIIFHENKYNKLLKKRLKKQPFAKRKRLFLFYISFSRTFSAQRIPSAAADMIPPAYPAPSAQG